MAHFRITGTISYTFVERSHGRKVIEMIIESEDKDSAKFTAIDKTIESIDEDEVAERYSDLKVEEIEPPPPPATDAEMWALQRDIAPTLLPLEALS